MTFPIAGLPVKKMRSHVLVEQRRRLRDAARDDGDGVRVEELRDHLGHHRGRRLGDLGGLHDRGVPGRDRRHQRAEREHERLVPRADDQRHPERVAAHAHVAGLQHDRRGLAPRLDPVVQVRERELGLVDVDVDVHEIGVGLVAAKVVPQRFAYRAAARFDHRLDRLQLLDPP